MFVRIPTIKRARKSDEIICDQLWLKILGGAFDNFWKTDDEARDLIWLRVRIDFRVYPLFARLLNQLMRPRMSILQIGT